MDSLKLWSETTPRRYISGIVALNLPTSPDSGDWHTVETLRALKRGAAIPLRLAGEGTEFDASEYFGAEGIIDASKVIEGLGESVQQPVYVATHARAIADIVMSRLPQGWKNLAHLNIDDWASQQCKQAVVVLLDKAQSRLNDNEKATLEGFLGQKIYEQRGVVGAA